MRSGSAPQTRKRASNLSINADLLNKARELDINLSATLEQALIAQIKEREQAAWLAENQAAIASYNAHAEQNGVFSDGLRSF